jgi:hypothetical protein
MANSMRRGVPPPRRPREPASTTPYGTSSGAGAGVDVFGGPVVDPTKNVLDLVNAESRYQDGMRDSMEHYQDSMREAETRFQNSMRETESRIQNWMRDAESKRVEALASQQRFYETRIADMLRTSVESTSTLVGNQLVSIQNTFNDRVARLEQFRYESSGRTSVTDPQVTDALSKLGASLISVQTTFTDTLSKMAASQSEAMTRRGASITGLQEQAGERHGRGIGINTAMGWIVAAATVAGGILTGIGYLIFHH